MSTREAATLYATGPAPLPVAELFRRRLLSDAMAALGRAVRSAAVPPGAPTLHALLAAVSQDRADPGTLDGLVRRVLLAMRARRTRVRTRLMTGATPG